MPYASPTLNALIISVARDLRDPGYKVFSTTEITDLINWGLIEVNRVYPLARVEVVDVTKDPATLKPQRSYLVESNEIYRVEVWRSSAFREQVPEGDEQSNTGWFLFGNLFTLPSWLTLDDVQDGLRVYGYQERDMLTSGTAVAETDAEAEMGVRLYATLTGYQRLQNDRAQFQQWMSLPGNNDISPTQLDGMANTYLAQWNRHRNQMRRLRR